MNFGKQKNGGGQRQAANNGVNSLKSGGNYSIIQVTNKIRIKNTYFINVYINIPKNYFYI